MIFCKTNYVFNNIISCNNNIPFQPDGESEMTVEEVAMGFIRVANEAMCRPIRALTQVGWAAFFFFFHELAYSRDERVGLHTDPRVTPPSDCTVAGQRSRHLSTRPGVFWRGGGAACLCHRQSPGHEDRLHTQVRPRAWLCRTCVWNVLVI